MKRKKIIVRKGNAYVPVDIYSIALFLSSQKLTFAIDFIGNKYLVDKSLSDLEDSIDPYTFFRVNRQNIINVDAIK
ncbi:MAG TPA: LytTR family DNA-binding domain-containing protein, partial [Ferruginibacter sp.]|nr:LytTR family DNA-binding domain-containing protein [Ferruginibacter sp.]